jgi:hypothetical protein
MVLFDGVLIYEELLDYYALVKLSLYLVDYDYEIEQKLPHVNPEHRI